MTKEMTACTRPASLINRSAVKRACLDILAAERPHLAMKFTRVSGGLLNDLETALRLTITKHIQTMPTNGKTLR